MTKFLRPILGLALILILANCSEDEPEAVGEENLVGTWEMTAISGETSSVVDFFGLPVTTTSTSVGSNIDYTITFTETTYESAGGYDLETTVQVAGQAADTQTNEFRNLSSSGTIRIEDGNVIVDGEFFDLGDNEISTGSEIGEQVLKFTFNGPNELVLTQDQDFNITDPTSGTEVDFSVNISTTFVRQ